MFRCRGVGAPRLQEAAMRWFLLACAIAFGGAVSARADDSRRMFDFTPVSATNPVVATIDGSVEIPLSEPRAYQQAERPKALPNPADFAQKRALLEELIDQYLLVDEAYRTGVTKLPPFVRQMEATRTMLLTDFMAARANDQAKKTPSTPDAVAMADRLFEATRIDVSNEAYALLQKRAQLIDTTSRDSSRGPIADTRAVAEEKLRDIVTATPDVAIVRYDDQTIKTRQLLVIYAGLPPPRPNLQTHDGFLAFVKPMIVPELMAREAAKEGMETDPFFRAKLIQNRNALLRFHMQGTIDRQANAAMKAPDFVDQLRAWYNTHAADYRRPAEKGGGVPPFGEVRSRVEADYSVVLVERLKAEQVAQLRRERRIQINDAALKAW